MMVLVIPSHRAFFKTSVYLLVFFLRVPYGCYSVLYMSCVIMYVSASCTRHDVCCCLSCRVARLWTVTV